MELQILPQYIRTAVISVVIIILAIVSFYGFRAGRDLAKSELVLGQTTAVMQALDYFFRDQDRYPSTVEFTDTGTFGVYVSQTPIRTVVSKQCPVPLAYNTFNQRAFTYVYCLPRGIGDELMGSHELTERDIVLRK